MVKYYDLTRTMAYPTFVVDLKGLLDQLLFHGSSGQKFEEPIQVSLQIQHVKHVRPISFILFGKVLHTRYMHRIIPGLIFIGAPSTLLVRDF